MLWMFAVSWEQCQDWVIISLCRLLSAAWTCLALCSRTASSSLKGLWLLWAGSASRFASAALGNWKTIPVCWLNMSVSCVHLQFTCQEYLKLDNFQKHYFTEKEASRNNKHIAKTCSNFVWQRKRSFGIWNIPWYEEKMLQNFRLFTRNPRVYIWEMHSPRVNLWGIQNGKGNNVETSAVYFWIQIQWKWIIYQMSFF